MEGFKTFAVFLLAFIALACFDNVPKWKKIQKTARSGEAWLESCKKKLAHEEYTLVERSYFTLLKNILTEADSASIKSALEKLNTPPALPPLPWLPYRAITPSATTYRGAWNWDCAFHALAVSRWDAELARDQIRIFLKYQAENGCFPDVLFEYGGIVTSFGKPPVLAWAYMVTHMRSPDMKMLEDAYPKFVRFEKFQMSTRGGAKDTLFHPDCECSSPKDRFQSSSFETGWDNSVRWDDNAPYTLWTIDLNCYMVMFYRALAFMANELNKTTDRDIWLNKASTLANVINHKLWNNDAQAYMDYNFVAKQFNNVLTPASFMPLYVKIAPKDKARSMANYAADTAIFYPGMPSVSYNNPKFKSSEYWRGPAWANLSYFAAKGLYYYGHDKTANDIRKRFLKWVAQNNDCIWEYYDSKDGKGLGAKQYGWTATFTLEFILNWDKNTDW